MAAQQPSRSSLANDPRARGFFYQVLLVAGLVALVAMGWRNAVVNMQARGIPMGFGFWDETAGFDINQALIPYSALSTYGRAFWVGLLNTLLVGAIGIVLATPLGFAVGLARLSPNWLLSKVALVYVELMRNTPLLLQLLFWYNAVLKTLPGPRQSLSLGGVVLPQQSRPLSAAPAVRRRRARWSSPRWRWRLSPRWRFASGRGGARRRAASARRSRSSRSSSSSVCRRSPISPPASRSAFRFAQLSGFNLSGGLQLHPEFAALTFGLVTYTAGFIAEIVRAGVLAVPHGQSEAAAALGLHRALAMRLVVVPQALRLIMPPLTSQYLNIIKNSSLAVFVGYPDLVLVFAGTVLNQTHAAVQVMAMTMAVYLAISLGVSFALNLFNARNALKER